MTREEALQAAEGLELAGIIHKPVTPSTLVDTLGRVLGEDLAAAPGPRAANRVLQQAQRDLAGARVLLVEDQPLNRELACDLLERAGMTVVVATNGQEALDRLNADGAFDGVLMDCQMPVLDGYSATERIREQAQWQSLPVIAMTASAMATDRERVLRSGMNDHITKPLDIIELRARIGMVDRLLAERRRLAEFARLVGQRAAAAAERQHLLAAVDEARAVHAREHVPHRVDVGRVVVLDQGDEGVLAGLHRRGAERGLHQEPGGIHRRWLAGCGAAVVAARARAADVVVVDACRRLPRHRGLANRSGRW